MKLIMTYYKKMIITYKKLFVMSFVIMAAVTVSNLLIPCGMRFLVDSISQANSLGQKELLFLLAAFAAFLLCMGVNTWMEIRWYLLLDKLGGLCMRDLTLKMEAALAAASLSDADKIGAEVLKHTMYADVLDVFRVTGHHIPSFISAVLTTIVCMVLAFAFSMKFAVFLVFSVGLGWYVSFLGRKRISQKAGKTNQKMKQCHAVCNQYIDSMTLVQTNDVLDYFQQETTRKLSDFIQTAKKEDRLMLFWSKLSEHYNTISTMLLSVLLLIPSWGGSIGNLIFFTMLSTVINSQGQNAQELLRQIMRAQVSFENVDKVCKLEPRQKAESLTDVESIEFDSVYFFYESGESALTQVSCCLQKGQMVRLMGENGCGKSTFIKLLLGLYRPDSGTIRINSQSVDAYCKHDMSRQFLYVGQEEIFLNETVENYLHIITQNKGETVTYLLKEYDMAADRAIENEGKSLSVGQRKKLLIMKMLLRIEEASVLIVDEIEAGLDQETREKYEQLLNFIAKKKNKLIIVVEHDPQGTIEFTKIMHFQSGRLVNFDNFQ